VLVVPPKDVTDGEESDGVGSGVDRLKLGAAGEGNWDSEGIAGTGSGEGPGPEVPDSAGLT
jgi:hypothetical protein